jgi:hypothetical protein
MSPDCSTRFGVAFLGGLSAPIAVIPPEHRTAVTLWNFQTADQSTASTALVAVDTSS